MKILHWNVNGLRSIVKKKGFKNEEDTFHDFINSVNADIICMNETKLSDDNINVGLEQYPYKKYSVSKTRKGYSGVAVYSKQKPINENYNQFDDEEGRVICLEYVEFFLICFYTPNAGIGLKRSEFKNKWLTELYSKIKLLQQINKNIVLVSDFNCAIDDIDVFNPKKHTKSPGFTDMERRDHKQLLDMGFCDPYRHLYKNKIIYTYFDYRSGARKRNNGWYIDKFLINSDMIDQVVDCEILSDIYGSDHIPITLTLKKNKSD